jgi:4-amino-4-deoxy-L-arabinose transferase-like glycosyltransferase
MSAAKSRGVGTPAAPPTGRGSSPVGSMRWLREAGSWIARRLADAPPLAVVALGCLVVVIYAYPGQMTQDSYDHLREARDGIWTDAHPPLIDLMWRIADFIVAGPFGMLAFQVVLFAAGLYLVFRRTFSPRRAAWATTALLLFPPVIVVLPVICKDAPMAGFLLLGAALLHAERRWVRIGGLVALAAATALRYNAFAATFPLILVAFEWAPGLPWLRRFAIAAAAWLATTLAAFGFNAAITDKKVHFWLSSLAVFDIVGTLTHVDEDLSDPELEELFAGTEIRVHHDIHGAIRRIYRPANYMQIISEDKQPILWALPINGYVPAPQAQRDALERAFTDVITANPGAYLEHRFTLMSRALWIGSRRPVGAIPSRKIHLPEYHVMLGMGIGWSGLQEMMTRWLTTVWRTIPIFLPWTYALVALLLLPLARRHRDLLALLLSGLGLELSLLPFAATSDYRYSHWMVVCTCIAVIALAARRARDARDAMALSTASAPR